MLGLHVFTEIQLYKTVWWEFILSIFMHRNLSLLGHSWSVKCWSFHWILGSSFIILLIPSGNLCSTIFVLLFCFLGPDPSHICNLCHSPRQHRILNPLSGARDRTSIFMDTSQVCFHWATKGTPVVLSFFSKIVWVPGDQRSFFFFFFYIRKCQSFSVERSWRYKICFESLRL